MAARQDQTLQIFLIIFIFLFLVTAVVAYLGWRGYSDQTQTAATLDTQLKEKTNQMQTQTTDLEDLRERMGFGRNDNTADVKKAADADMKTLRRRGCRRSEPDVSQSVGSSRCRECADDRARGEAEAECQRAR